MRYLPTGKQMQMADFNTIENIGIPSLVLMERAALKTVEVMEKENIDLSDTVVFCGSGNNGGDGFAVARLLDEKGFNVTVVFVGKESSMSEGCKIQRDICVKKGILVVSDTNRDDFTTVIDAVFGVGLNREIKGTYVNVIERMNGMKGYKIAVDIPSGICSATGNILGVVFKADLTATFQCEKVGMVMFPGKMYTGKTVVCQIGIDTSIYKEIEDICFTYDKTDINELIPKRRPDTHKGSYGRVLMITGSKGMAGAAFLSAYGAYKCGAGLVQIYTAEENRTVLQSLLPEAIISTYTEHDADKIKELLLWADVICIGCGLGTSDISNDILSTVLKNNDKPIVIDADGLNMLKDKTSIINKKDYPVIITPHMMEMSRLTGKSVKEIKEKRLEIIKNYTLNNKVVCALKDARTVVTKDKKQYYINTSGNNSMAKGGSGDVLAGIITALLAQGADDFTAACLGVYIHGCSGDMARDLHGEYSVIGRELAEAVECVLKDKEFKL